MSEIGDRARDEGPEKHRRASDSPPTLSPHEHGPAAAQTPSTEAELAQLRTQLRVTREQRMQLQRSLAQSAGIEAGIATVERDIDTLTSAPVIQSRDRVVDLTAKLSECWASIDWYRLILARVEAHGFAVESLPHARQLQAALDTEARARAELAELFVHEQVPLRVPPAQAPPQPQHPYRDGRAERQREIFEQAGRRDARKTRSGTRRPRDPHGPR